MSGMPVVPHLIKIVGPTENLNELQMEVNEELENIATSIVNGVQLYETNQGWLVLIWYKIVR